MRACARARPRTLPHQPELKEKALFHRGIMLSDVRHDQACIVQACFFALPVAAVPHVFPQPRPHLALGPQALGHQYRDNMIILNYQGQEIRLEGNTITTADALTKSLAEGAVEQFVNRDLTGSYWPNNESIAANALMKYMGAEVVSMVNEHDDDDVFGKQTIF